MKTISKLVVLSYSFNDNTTRSNEFKVALFNFWVLVSKFSWLLTAEAMRRHKRTDASLLLVASSKPTIKDSKNECRKVDRVFQSALKEAIPAAIESSFYPEILEGDGIWNCRCSRLRYGSVSYFYVKNLFDARSIGIPVSTRPLDSINTYLGTLILSKLHSIDYRGTDGVIYFIWKGGQACILEDDENPPKVVRESMKRTSKKLLFLSLMMQDEGEKVHHESMGGYLSSPKKQNRGPDAEATIEITTQDFIVATDILHVILNEEKLLGVTTASWELEVNANAKYFKKSTITDLHRTSNVHLASLLDFTLNGALTATILYGGRNGMNMHTAIVVCFEMMGLSHLGSQKIIEQAPIEGISPVFISVFTLRTR